MKTLPFLSLVVALSGPSFEGPCSGQSPESPKQKDPPREGLRYRETPPNPLPVSEALGPVERTSKLIGAAVKDAGGEKIGKIRDLTIDLSAGRVLQVIVSSGGLLGVGGKHIALPPTTLTVDPSGDVTTQVSRQKFDDAPEFVLEKWQENIRPEQVSSMYRYYDLEPRLVPRHWKQEAGNVPRAETTEPVLAGSIERATKLVGLTVTHDGGKEVGKVSDLVVDLSTARVPLVLVSVGGFLGIGDELNAVPPSLLRYEIDPGQVVLQVSKETLQTAPRFKTSQWSEYSNSNKFHEVYRVYGVKPYFEGSPASDNTRQYVRDRQPDSLTPSDQGDSESDIKTTAEIRRIVTREDGFSVAAQNVKIITLNGRVTLRGEVKSVTEKDRIEALAKSVAGADKVDNQIQVASVNPDK